MAGALALLLAGCGAGRNFGYDCSNGQADGYGACIPNHHAPKAVEAAARTAFAGEDMDDLACVNANEFTFKRKDVHLWLCRRIVDGRVITDGRFVCVAAHEDGQVILDADLKRMPRRELICR